MAEAKGNFHLLYCYSFFLSNANVRHYSSSFFKLT